MPPLPEEPAVSLPGAGPGAPDRFFYGGQAVIEGVMMRGRDHYAVAVRRPSTGEIVVTTGRLTSRLYTSRFWKQPVARGLALLAEQLHLGMKSLIWAAAVSAGDHDVELRRRDVAVSTAIAVALALGLFIGLPLLGAGLAVRNSGSFWFVLVEGLIRVTLVFGYLALIGRIPDVRRVFQYHGAEHKTINAFEAGWPLEVAGVRRASVLHPRCGTGFLLVVLAVSIIVFSLVALAHPNWFWLVVSRVAGVPVIAGLSYEWIRLLAAHRDRAAARLLLVPVLYTQKLTTREPDDGQIEVGIAAFEAARREGDLAAA